MQMFFDGHYPTLPDYWVFSKTEPRHIPKYPAVYIIISQSGSVKYVGQTVNLRQRYTEHNGKTLLQNDKFGWVKCRVEELMFVECWFIATLRPWANAKQDRNARKSPLNKSAILDVSASKVWKRGRTVEVNESTINQKRKWQGKIEEVDQKRVKVSGIWVSKHKVAILLP